jgi:uncharacterized protein
LWVTIPVQERFLIQAPIEKVWAYFENPPQVVPCLPGAELLEVVDETAFRGQVRLQVGPVAAHYDGTVTIEKIDEQQKSMALVARGDQKGMVGHAEAHITFSLRPMGPAETEVVIDAELALAGRLAQFGGAMIQMVSRQLFRKFGHCVRQALTAEAKVREEGGERWADQK